MLTFIVIDAAPHSPHRFAPGIIRPAIFSPRYTLEDIKELIYDHISEHKKLDNQSDYEKAESIAFNAVNNLIDDLEVSITNYKRIKEYLLSYHSYKSRMKRFYLS